ncbi:hypothetical protein [Kordia sp.]|uniref:hypothetical protein n=1 Tax=Kordia sp. TaxID=1965332 RepID=UPI0025B9C773|nr:hypothetical protein [Kordia sp.]MCH2194279.1 hypothetical protein [Kordia sp.]
MKKKKFSNLGLNKNIVSSLNKNMLLGGNGSIPANTLGCTGFCSVGGCQSLNGCTAQSILCNDGPSEFGAGGCTHQQEN